jgi:formiminotetrahydrofolate cyclodeaminase
MTENEKQADLLSMTVRQFVAATAGKTPTPGGGSVAGVVGSLAVALGEMALNFSIGKKKFAEHADEHRHLLSRFGRAREMFQQLVADDIAAFTTYQEASRLADGPQKDQAMEIATAAAIDVPREAAKLALAVLGDLETLAKMCNQYLISDLVAAAALCEAVSRLCDYNVRINIVNVRDRGAAEQLRLGSAGDLAAAVACRNRIEESIREVLP